MDLPKLALTINYNTILEVPSKDKTKYKVIDVADTFKGIAELRQEICIEAQHISNILSEQEGGKRMIDIYDIHISIPRISVVKDLSNALVVRSDNTFVSLSEIVLLSDWANAFSYYKWNAYVFSKDDICPIVSIASKIVFERYGIIFDSKKVFKNLKNEEDIDTVLNLLYDKYKYLDINKQEPKRFSIDRLLLCKQLDMGSTKAMDIKGKKRFMWELEKFVAMRLRPFPEFFNVYRYMENDDVFSGVESRISFIDSYWESNQYRYRYRYRDRDKWEEFVNFSHLTNHEICHEMFWNAFRGRSKMYIQIQDLRFDEDGIFYKPDETIDGNRIDGEDENKVIML